MNPLPKEETKKVQSPCWGSHQQRKVASLGLETGSWSKRGWGTLEVSRMWLASGLTEQVWSSKPQDQNQLFLRAGGLKIHLGSSALAHAQDVSDEPA